MVDVAQIDDDRLAQLEWEGWGNAMTPAENPRDMLAFARSLFLPPNKKDQPPEIYDPDGHLVQLEALRLLSSPKFRSFVLVACTQDGKTWLLIILLFWLATEHKEAVILGAPDLRLAQDMWLQKFNPALRASGLAAFIPTTGDGSGGGSNVETVQLNGGGTIILLGAGGANGSGQAGRTARFVIVDEFGKVKPTLAGKFDRRADSYDTEGRLVKAGTVEHDLDDPLLQAYEDSSQARMIWRCHLCDGWTPLEWEQVTCDYKTDKRAEASARIACVCCGVNWTDAERKANLRHGRLVHAGQTVDAAGFVTGPEPETYTAGLRWGALDSPRRSLGTLAIQYRKAKIEYDRGNAQPLIDFYHDQLARAAPIEDGREELTRTAMATRSAGSDYDAVQLLDERGVAAFRYAVPVVPRGVRWLTAAIDQSLRRLWYSIYGHDAEGRMWLLAWGRVVVSGDLDQPTDDQRTTALDLLMGLIDRGLPSSTGAPMPVQITGIDIGEFSAHTRDWAQGRERVVLVRGDRDRVLKGMPENSGKIEHTEEGWYQERIYENHGAGSHRILWIAATVKTELHRSLSRAPDTTGATLIPRGLAADDETVKQLTAERFVRLPGGSWGWIKANHSRNDLWDVAYYNKALIRWLQQRQSWMLSESVGASADSSDDSTELPDLSWR